MKTLSALVLCLFLLPSQAQEFSDPVKTFISQDATTIAITNVTLIDGTGEPIKTNQTVLINNGIIREVGATGDVQIPEGTTRIEGAGKTMIPGLVMLHEHLFYTSLRFENRFNVGQMSFTFPRLYLAGGVTTMRTGGSIQPQADLNIKRWIDQGKMTGPKMDVTGPFIEREGTNIPVLGVINSSHEVSKMVNYWADKGVTSFKVYNNITAEDLNVCVEEAHKRGLKVTGHLCSLTYKEASELGIDNLEHGFMASSDFNRNKTKDQCDPFGARQGLVNQDIDGAAINELIDLLIRNGTTLTSTPNVFEPYTDHEVVPGGGFEALAPVYQKEVQKRYDRGLGKDSIAAVVFSKNLIWLRRFYDKGGLLVAGTDPTGAGRTVAGYANQRTVEIFVENGFALEEAIKICTLNGAQFLGRDQEIGTIAPGKKADLVLIDGDLREDIRSIRKMETVFKDGVGFDSQLMFESVKGQVGLN